AYYFCQAASLGNLKAAYNLFICFNEGGNGVVKDPSLAAFWFEVAKELKDSRCMKSPYPLYGPVLRTSSFAAT
ncbi:MAG TPA: hypothetical protein VEY70_12700, partial [Metabacillus sp.]|nr:hypothetical protein [Metabacillus sp.]